MRYTEAPGRRAEMLRRLTADGYVSSAQLAAEFGVSEMTVRRDLRQLHVDGLAVRILGGARVAGHAVPFEERGRAGGREKDAIARVCADLVRGAATVALDAGTTVAPLTGLLESGTTVISHSEPVLALATARGDLDVHALGGHYVPEARAYYGPATRAALEGFAVEVAVLSATAVDATGAVCASAPDADVKRGLIDSAGRVVLAVDAGKLGAAAAHRIAPFSRIHVLVTDAAADPDELERIRRAGTEVVVAEAVVAEATVAEATVASAT